MIQSKIQKNTLLSILCIALFLISTTLLGMNIHLEKIINRQNEVIVLQQERAFTQQETIEVLEQLLEEQTRASDTLYELAVLHGILQEEE